MSLLWGRNRGQRKKCRYCGEWLEEKEVITSSKEEQPTDKEELTRERGEEQSDKRKDSADETNIKEIQSTSENSGIGDDRAGTIYRQKKSVKFIFLGLAILCLILAICTFNFPIEFNYIFGSGTYFVGFSILCLVFLWIFAMSFGEQREGKIYLDKEGHLDISTPRTYQALKKPAFVRAMSRSQPLKGEALQSFEYEGGRVKIVTNKGNSIEAPLSELIWKYSMTKPKDVGDWYIYKYVLTDKDGNAITYYRNHATFAENEWDDMNMLLSLSGKVEEGKISKINKKMTSLLEKVQDFDFSDIVGSAVSATADSVFTGSNKVIDMVKVKIYGKKKKNKFWTILGKIKDWFILGLLVLYVLAVLVINIIQIIDYFSDSKDNYEIVTDESVYDGYEGGEASQEMNEGVTDQGNATTLTDLISFLDPKFYDYELTTYRMGSDNKMNQIYMESGSTNAPIEASGVISNHEISMEGWITEGGTIHGRYHNENGINLDFNGYIRPDDSLYIQLGHDGEKSDWYLYPVSSELPEGYARYEGKWGKSQKDSYIIFSER